MFLPRSNNNGNGVSINTTFYTSYSGDSMLTIGGWNRQLSIKLYPAIGKDANGVTQYSNEQQVITAIKEENAIALLQGFNDVIKPAIENSTEAKVTISISGKNDQKALSIYYDGKDAYCEIATNVNSDGTTDKKNVISHKFNKRNYMVGYNYIDGSGSEVSVESDLFNFMEKIKGLQKLVPMTAHSINYSNANKSVFKSNNQAAVSNSYSAPTNSYDGAISDFLPIS